MATLVLTKPWPKLCPSPSPSLDPDSNQVGRSGKLRVSRLRLESHLRPVELEECVDLAPGEPTDLMLCVRLHEAVAPKFAAEFGEEGRPCLV